MAGIFLSYARDDLAKAERIAQVLEAAGHSVWWDRQLHAGSSFSAEIDKELERADLILVLWSRHSVKSAWVQDEAGVGRDSGRLLPILLEGVMPPLGFRQYHALDLSRWKDRDKESLTQAIESRLSGAPLPRASRTGRFAWLGQRRIWAAAATLLVIGAVAMTLFVLRPGRATAEPASIAVLPFKNMSAGEPYFAEGVAEEILNQLAREPQFKVAGQTSSAMFKDAADIRDVGRRLHVAYVLEGSVRSSGDQVRVNVALVDAKQGMRLWSQDFRGKLNDIFAIQDTIGQQVAAHLKRQLVRQVVLKGTTTSGDVYSLYVTGRSLIRTREPAKIAVAVDLLKRAVKLDPNFAPGWAQLALANNFDRHFGHQGDPNYGLPLDQQIAMAERAIALAPKLAEAHAIAGMILMSNETADAKMNRRGAQELEKAVKLDPNDSMAWYWLFIRRFDELDFDGALDAMRRTAAIDPFFVFSDQYAFLAWNMGKRDEALRFLKDRIQNHPDPYIREFARMSLAFMQNDWSGAYRHAKAARDLASPDNRREAEEYMGTYLAYLGLFDQARGLVDDYYLEMRQGKAPRELPNFIKNVAKRPLGFWLAVKEEPRPVPRMLVNTGNSAVLLMFYDRAFSSPENMVARYSKVEIVDIAPMLAIALQQAGRGAEAKRMLQLADKLASDSIRRTHIPLTVQVIYSRLWAALGRKELAISTLERAVAQGWRPSDGEMQKVTDEPAYRAIRDDPRLRRVDAIIANDVARERRELLAAGS